MALRANPSFAFASNYKPFRNYELVYRQPIKSLFGRLLHMAFVDIAKAAPRVSIIPLLYAQAGSWKWAAIQLYDYGLEVHRFEAG